MRSLKNLYLMQVSGTTVVNCRTTFIRMLETVGYNVVELIILKLYLDVLNNFDIIILMQII